VAVKQAEVPRQSGLFQNEKAVQAFSAFSAQQLRGDQLLSPLDSGLRGPESQRLRWRLSRNRETGVRPWRCECLHSCIQAFCAMLLERHRARAGSFFDASITSLPKLHG